MEAGAVKKSLLFSILIIATLIVGSLSACTDNGETSGMDTTLSQTPAASGIENASPSPQPSAFSSSPAVYDLTDISKLEHARPYQVIKEGRLVNQDPNRTVGLWYIVSTEASGFEEYAWTAVRAVLDLYNQYRRDHTAVLLIPHPEVRVVYAHAGYSADGRGAAGMTGNAPAVPLYWKVRAMDDQPLTEMELEVTRLWQKKQQDFPNPNPASSLSYDEKALRQYIADTLNISYDETLVRQRNMKEIVITEECVVSFDGAG
jgi:hypothetical protein